MERLKKLKFDNEDERLYIERCIPMLTHLQICEGFQKILGD
jgi:hypothetical protein